MGRSTELTEFERGTALVCQLYNKSVYKISSLIDIEWSTVSAIISKWNLLEPQELTREVADHHQVTECLVV